LLGKSQVTDSNMKICNEVQGLEEDKKSQIGTTWEKKC